MPFDPESGEYDYESARAAGLGPDATGHWPSRDPKTGKLLKGRAHPTYHKTEAGEKAAGYEITQGADMRYYSQQGTGMQGGGMDFGSFGNINPEKFEWLVQNVDPVPFMQAAQQMEMAPPTHPEEPTGMSYGQMLGKEPGQGAVPGGGAPGAGMGNIDLSALMQAMQPQTPPMRPAPAAQPAKSPPMTFRPVQQPDINKVPSLAEILGRA